MKTILAQNAKNCPFQYMQINGSHASWIFYWSLLFFKSIVKNEFLTPKYPRIEVLVMIVAPQDQFYIETNLAIAHLHNLFNMLIYPPRIQFHQKTLYLTPWHSTPSRLLD